MVDVYGQLSRWMDPAISGLFESIAVNVQARWIGRGKLFHCCSPARVMCILEDLSSSV